MQLDGSGWVPDGGILRDRDLTGGSLAHRLREGNGQLAGGNCDGIRPRSRVIAGDRSNRLTGRKTPNGRC
jgi:hypothetical protein